MNPVLLSQVSLKQPSRLRDLPRWCVLSASALLLSGCMVGPKYTKPAVSLAPTTSPATQPANQYDQYKETDPNWHQANPADAALKGEWWTIFNDPQLTALEVQVPKTNQTLRAAEANFRTARAQIKINHADLYPTLGVAPFVGGERESNSRPYFNPPSPNNGLADLLVPVDFNYEVDLWGRIRRNIAASKEETQASAADLANVLLSLQTELALDYFEVRSADAAKKLLDDTVQQYVEALRVTTNRFEGGITSKADVSQAETQLQAAMVQASDIAATRAQFEHAIAILTGQPPAVFSLPPVVATIAPPSIPVGLPSELLERRPDIAAAERRINEANERIGIARAAYFPTLNLSAAAGFEGSSATNLFNRSSFIYSLGPTLGETFFDAGRRAGISQQAYAQYDETAAQYRQTALTAFQQVEDNLVLLRVLADEAKQQHAATAAAQEAEQIFNNRYVGGVDNYLQVITAQTTALNNERNEIDIMRRRMDASVLLIKALGGGWTTAQLPTY
ncbi:efflux transporter outer membrane subunit [Granulicella sp. WH15]|uniref:efflux transporter outer membrane subunit n=1 Tax=Granulicella sp. WH15 TaxID=2602070 RepID=UPI0013668333|nr:efflux transporter outer membrane subunit [Granulicella sp. WH15]QHN04632.1 efflux transporter outer membrane subunit [Granulicella sp. WH15]